MNRRRAGASRRRHSASSPAASSARSGRTTTTRPSRSVSSEPAAPPAAVTPPSRAPGGAAMYPQARAAAVPCERRRGRCWRRAGPLDERLVSRLPGPAGTAVRRPGIKAFRGRAARVARRQPTGSTSLHVRTSPGGTAPSRPGGGVRSGAGLLTPGPAGTASHAVTAYLACRRPGPPCCGRAATAARHRSASMFPVCAFTRSTRNEGSQRLGSVSHCRAEVFLQTAQEPLVARPAAGGVLADRRLRPWHASAVGAATRALAAVRIYFGVRGTGRARRRAHG